MKYAVGQQVRVIADIRSGMSVNFGVTYNMSRLAGQIVTIKEARMSMHGDKELYKIKESEANWSDMLFEPITHTPDETFKLYLNGSINETEYEELMRKGGQV